ncbi:MAG: insulinase family protein [Bacteroidetes bacterium]|nr:insulinase family protein [Bacteroidota bacterium]
MKHLAAIGLIFASTISFSQTKKATTVDAKTPALKYEVAKNDPLNTRIYTLKNGMKVYLSVYKNAPRIQTYIAVRAGSKNDPANATGLAHYLEHMVFKGTDAYGTKDFKKESIEIKKIENLYEVYRATKDEAKRKQIYHQIDSISGVAAKYAIANEYDKMLAGIGADGTNAFTFFDQTVYVNDIPSNQINNFLKIEAERFRKPILRLFHTELEAVYEEKNRGLDSDGDKVFEAIMASLYKNHTYGTQTTIGTIDHLKNPSMVEINKFYNTYYKPNNMALVMSGDFDPDQVAKEAEKTLGKLVQKPVPTFTFQPESPITSKIIKNVVGPDPSSVNIAWRVSGYGTKDADISDVVSSILYNNVAGLLDLNLNQAQKVLSSNVLNLILKDHGIIGISGEPKEGQKLEDVEKLILEQIALLRKGEFADWLLDAVKTEIKLSSTKELESNNSRGMKMVDAFINNQKWQSEVDYLERINKITKQDIIAFANKYLGDNNYCVVYKNIGEDTSIQKVEKPSITPVEVDRDNASPFVQTVMTNSVNNIQPVFLDFEKDIVKSTIKSNIPIYYVNNKENKLFNLYYKFDMGNNNDKLLPIVAKYFDYLGTTDMTPAQVKQEMYKLGTSLNVYIDDENVWVSVNGIEENFYKTVQLFEKLFTNPVIDKTTLTNVIADYKKSRNDEKLQKRIVMQGLTQYARFGPSNPFSNKFTDEELDKITVDDIKYKILLLLSYQHSVLFYGPQKIDDVKMTLNSYHTVPDQLKPVPAPKEFILKTLQNEVYTTDFDMKQAEIVFLSNGKDYNVNDVPVTKLYNAYFGDGMSGVVFQDLRESKALAYSCYSRFNLPNKLTKKSFNYSYIGSQADKMGDALKGMTDLLNNMPKSDVSFTSAKEMLNAEMSTQRITKSDILFAYLSAMDLGLNYDIRKTVFDKLPSLNFDEIKKFQNETISNKPTTIVVVAKKENIDTKVLEKYGTIKFVTLKEIFGY